MEEFSRLAEQVKFIRHSYRVSVHKDQPLRIDKNGAKWLQRGPVSVTLREGRLLDMAQQWFPECNAQCLNKKASLLTSNVASQGR